MDILYRDQKTDVGSRRSEVGVQRTEVRGRKTEDGGQRSEDGSRRTEVGGLRLWFGGRESGFLLSGFHPNFLKQYDKSVNKKTGQEKIIFFTRINIEQGSDSSRVKEHKGSS